MQNPGNGFCAPEHVQELLSVSDVSMGHVATSIALARSFSELPATGRNAESDKESVRLS